MTPSASQSIKLGLLRGYPVEFRLISKKGAVQLVQKTKHGWHGGKTYSSIDAAKAAIQESI